MDRPNPFSSATLHHVAILISRSPLWRGCPVVLLVLGLFALSPTARAVIPAPDGGYPNGNTAEGDSALANITMGFEDTAIGFQALSTDTAGFRNTAVGFDALSNSTVGSINTAIGTTALFNNTSGSYNTAAGVGALSSNTSGNLNTAGGFNALALSTTGDYNTAAGAFALVQNETGFRNSGNGAYALWANTTGHNNVADGYQALFHNSTGSFNIAVGLNAGLNLTTGSNNIDIGNAGFAADSNKIRIGRQDIHAATFIAGIRGVTVPNGIEVVIGPTGQLGTVQSSSRCKDDIQPMADNSKAILKFKPVTFHYNQELDPDKVPQFGLIAEEVEKVNPALVARDENGKVMTVRYEAVNAMLLNEFLKEHRNVTQQQGTIAELKTTVAQQQKQIEALTATVQKVSDQIALSKPLAQLVANP